MSPPRSSSAYREIAPPPDLRGLVRCFWSIREPFECGTNRALPRALRGERRVLPDNCADWIFDLSERAGAEDRDGGAGKELRAIAVGPMTRPLVVEPRAGSILFGVRFAPGRWRGLFGGEAMAMRDRRCDLLALDLDAGGAPGRLLERLLDAPDDRALARAAVTELRRVARLGTGDPLVECAMAALEASAGSLRIDAVARRLGCTRQHLAALFRREVGLGPKTFGAVLRFRSALDEGGRDSTLGWAEVALRFGYSDQSHLLRDFRRFAGAPPSRLAP